MNGNDNIYNFGFELATDSLIKKLINDRLSQDSKFDYKVDYILEEPGIKRTSDDLTTYLRLSAFNPNQYLLIKMQDDKLISSYLLRLTGVYTIALLLLAFGLILGVILVVRDISRLTLLENELKEKHARFDLIGKSKKITHALLR